MAQAIQDTGLPGLSFRSEPKRSYPNSRLAGHLLGYVDVYNYGIAGVERVLNAYEGVRRADSATVNTAPPLRLTIDMRIQYGLEQELRAGIKKFNAEAAAGILIDVHNGEIWAAASLSSLLILRPLWCQNILNGVAGCCGSTTPSSNRICRS